MKLLELEIKNIRGIKNIQIKPEEKNFLLLGPNGSGKSAVVDAIDFLLTGRMTRLMGEGTKEISITKHGAHIDIDDLTTVEVRALIKLPGHSSPIELKRNLEKPTVLNYDRSLAHLVEPLERLAKSGQHILTRREILKFITAESGKRADEIQSILNIRDLEEIRKTLVKTNHDLKKELDACKKQHDKFKLEIVEKLGIQNFSEDLITRKINDYRTVIGGEPLEELDSNSIKKGINPLVTTSKGEVLNIDLFTQDIQNLKNYSSNDNIQNITDRIGNLESVITKIQNDSKLKSSLDRRRLIEQGLHLLDENNICPLCDTKWPDGNSIRKYLETKLENVKEVQNYVTEIGNQSSFFIEIIKRTIKSLERLIIHTAKHADLKKIETLLLDWKIELEELHTLLDDILDTTNKPDSIIGLLKRVLTRQIPENDLDQIYMKVAEASPQSNPQQTAWDILTNLEHSFKDYEESLLELGNIELSYKRSSILRKTFQETRDRVLRGLYEDIESRFVKLYRELHDSDESNFKAEFKHQEASFDIGVDFYGRGINPPHALHSEGHQDSMGICLFLALTEKITTGLIDMVILDDVVMSVDSEHRRSLCGMLNNNFPDRQFLMTTHDKIWASQLRHTGFVKAKQCMEFYDWNIDTGPKFNQLVDIWKRIEECLSKNDVPSAAFQLRRGSEEFFSVLSDSLRASIRYDKDGVNDFNEFLSSAISRYDKLLGKAKESAQSWGQDEKFKLVAAIDKSSKEIFKKVFGEKWSININVHYNEWANFSPDDFEPVVKAFKELMDLFICKSCQSNIYIVVEDNEEQTLRCSCSDIDWNLVPRPKSSTNNI